MVFPDGITVNDKQKFGTARKGLLYQEASLLEAEVKTSKKTQNDSESLVVTHLGCTWNAVIEDLIRLSGLLDDEESDNV